MFTGLIERRGRIAGLRKTASEVRLRVESPGLGPVGRGESVAVDGVCLTAVAAGRDGFEAVLSPETLSRTTLGDRSAGDEVNLERALRLGDRLGGHLVQGHVDGVGVVQEVRPEGSGARMRIALPADLGPYVVLKGSIAVDGVSLTVAGRTDAAFEVALIPETLEVTGLGRRRAGDAVNLEVDLIGRYVVETLRGRETGAGEPGLTRAFLESRGFAAGEVVR